MCWCDKQNSMATTDQEFHLTLTLFDSIEILNEQFQFKVYWQTRNLSNLSMTTIDNYSISSIRRTNHRNKFLPFSPKTETNYQKICKSILKLINTYWVVTEKLWQLSKKRLSFHKLRLPALLIESMQRLLTSEERIAFSHSYPMNLSVQSFFFHYLSWPSAWGWECLCQRWRIFAFVFPSILSDVLDCQLVVGGSYQPKRVSPD